MKNVTEVISNSLPRFTDSNSDPFAQVRSGDLTKTQRGAIKYFFERLQRIYQAEYRRQLPDRDTVKAAKAEFGAMVMDMPKSSIDRGLRALHDDLGNIASEYRFMNLDPIIQLVKNGGNSNGQRPGAYKVFSTKKDLEKLSEPKRFKEKRKEKAIGHLDDIMGMFDD